MALSALAVKVYELRILRGMTQEALARASDVPVGQVYRIEAGKTVPTIAVVVKMARAMGVSPSELAEAAGVE